MVVFIQDAHDSLEAQENTAKIINHLVTNYGVKTVFEEGYEGPVPTDKYFGFIKDPKIKEKVSYFLMDHLRVGGAEYAHINRTKDFNLIGADSLKLHKENIDQYRLSAEKKDAITKDLKALEKELKSLADSRFPKPLKEWLKTKEQFDAKKLDLFTYLGRTMPLVGKHGAEKGLGLIGFILEAVRLNDPAVIEKAKHIDAREVFGELIKLEQDVAEIYLHDATDKQLLEYYKTLALFRRLNELQVSQEEYEAVKASLKAFDTDSFARFIFSQAPKTLILSRMWERNIKDAIRFYEMAQQRDQSLSNAFDQYFVAETTDHRRQTIDQKTQSSVSSLQSLKLSGSEPAILVYGGFHKEAIKRILENKGMNYIIVSPRITKPSPRHEGFYKRLMTEGHHAFEMPFLLSRATRPLPLVAESEPVVRAEVREVYDTLLAHPDADPSVLERYFSKVSKRSEIPRSEVREEGDGESAVAAPQTKQIALADWDKPQYAPYVGQAMAFARQYMMADARDYMPVFSDDGKWVGLRNGSPGISVANLQTGERLDSLIGTDIDGTHFSPDGSWLFVYKNPYKTLGRAYLVNLKTRKVVYLNLGIFAQLTQAHRTLWVDHVEFSPDSRWMSVRYDRWLLAVIDLQDPSKPAVLRKKVQFSGFFPDNSKMWIKTERRGYGSLRDWVPAIHGMQVLDLSTGKDIVSFENRPDYLSEYVSPDGSKLLIEELAEPNCISVVYDFNRPLVDGMAVLVLQGKFNGRFLANNRLLITEKNKVETHEFYNFSDGSTKPVSRVDLVKTWKNKYLFTEGHGKVLDADTGAEILDLKQVVGSDPVSVELSPDGNRVVATTKTEERFLINVQTKRVEKRFPYVYWSSPSFSPNSRWLFLEDGKNKVIYDLRNSKTVDFEGWARGYLENGRYVVMLNKKEEMKIFNTETGRFLPIALPVNHFDTEPPGMLLSGPSYQLASGGDGIKSSANYLVLHYDNGNERQNFDHIYQFINLSELSSNPLLEALDESWGAGAPLGLELLSLLLKWGAIKTEDDFKRYVRLLDPLIQRFNKAADSLDSMRILKAFRRTRIFETLHEKSGDVLRHFQFYVELMEQRRPLLAQIMNKVFEAVKKGLVSAELPDAEQTEIKRFIERTGGFNLVFYDYFRNKGSAEDLSLKHLLGNPDSISPEIRKAALEILRRFDPTIDPENLDRLKTLSETEKNLTKTFFAYLVVDLKGLNIGNQQVVRMYLYDMIRKNPFLEEKDAVRRVNADIVPALRTLEMLGLPPNMGAELAEESGSKETMERKGALSNFFMQTLTEHQVRPSDMTNQKGPGLFQQGKEHLELRLLPGTYPVIYLNLLMHLKTGLLGPESDLSTTIQGELDQEALLILCLGLFNFGPLVPLSAQTLGDAINFGNAYQSYIGQTVDTGTGEILKDQTQTYFADKTFGWIGQLFAKKSAEGKGFFDGAGAPITKERAITEILQQDLEMKFVLSSFAFSFLHEKNSKAAQEYLEFKDRITGFLFELKDDRGNPLFNAVEIAVISGQERKEFYFKAVGPNATPLKLDEERVRTLLFRLRDYFEAHREDLSKFREVAREGVAKLKDSLYQAKPLTRRIMEAVKAGPEGLKSVIPAEDELIAALYGDVEGIAPEEAAEVLGAVGTEKGRDALQVLSGHNNGSELQSAVERGLKMFSDRLRVAAAPVRSEVRANEAAKPAKADMSSVAAPLETLVPQRGQWHLIGEAFKRAMFRLAKAGTAKELRQKSFYKIASAIGAKEIKDKQFSKVFNSPTFVVSPKLFEQIQKERIAFMKQHGIKRPLRPKDLYSTIPNFNYVAPEVTLLRPELAMLHPEIDGPGIYYHRILIDELVGHDREFMVLFHEVFEDEFVRAGLTDANFSSVFGHAHPMVLIGELYLAALFGQDILEATIDVIRMHLLDIKKQYESPWERDNSAMPKETRKIIQYMKKQREEFLRRANAPTRRAEEEHERKRTRIFRTIDAFLDVLAAAEKPDFVTSISKGILQGNGPSLASPGIKMLPPLPEAPAPGGVTQSDKPNSLVRSASPAKVGAAGAVTDKTHRIYRKLDNYAFVQDAEYVRWLLGEESTALSKSQKIALRDTLTGQKPKSIGTVLKVSEQRVHVYIDDALHLAEKHYKEVYLLRDKPLTDNSSASRLGPWSKHAERNMTGLTIGDLREPGAGRFSDSVSVEVREKLTAHNLATPPKESISVLGLGLSKRAEDALMNGDITTVGKLIEKTAQDLLIKYRGFGKALLVEVRNRLAAHVLALKGEDSAMWAEAVTGVVTIALSRDRVEKIVTVSAEEDVKLASGSTLARFRMINGQYLILKFYRNIVTDKILITIQPVYRKDQIWRDPFWKMRHELKQYIPYLSAQEILNLMTALNILVLGGNATVKDVFDIFFINNRREFNKKIRQYFTGELTYKPVKNMLSSPDLSVINLFGWIHAYGTRELKNIIQGTKKKVSVLDLGTNFGDFIFTSHTLLSEYADRIGYVGVDISEEYLRTAVDHSRGLTNLSAQIMEGDIEEPGLKERLLNSNGGEPYDLVLLNHIAEHLEDKNVVNQLIGWLSITRKSMIISVPLDEDIAGTICLHDKQFTEASLIEIGRRIEEITSGIVVADVANVDSGILTLRRVSKALTTEAMKQRKSRTRSEVRREEKNTNERAKTFGDFAASYQGSIYYPASGFDLDSLRRLAKLFPKVSEFVYVDNFNYRDAAAPPVLPPVNAVTVKRALREDWGIDLEIDLEKLEINVISRNELNIHLVFGSDPSIEEWLRGRHFNIHLLISDLKDLSKRFDVVYVQTPGLGGRLSEQTDFWNIIAGQLNRYLIVSNDTTTLPAENRFQEVATHDVEGKFLTAATFNIYENRRSEVRSRKEQEAEFQRVITDKEGLAHFLLTEIFKRMDEGQQARALAAFDVPSGADLRLLSPDSIQAETGRSVSEWQPEDTRYVMQRVYLMERKRQDLLAEFDQRSIDKNIMGLNLFLQATGEGALAMGGRRWLSALPFRRFLEIANLQKAGQFISARPGMMAPNYREAFEIFQDNNEPSPFGEVVKTVEDDYQKPLDQLFENLSLSSQPPVYLKQLHVGSVADIFLAREKVEKKFMVLKIITPSKREKMMAGLKLLEGVMEELEKQKDRFSGVETIRISPVRFFREFLKAVLRELDMELEFEQATKLISRYPPGFHRPRLFRDGTTKNILAMEYVPGVKVTEIKDPVLRRKLGNRIFWFILFQAVADGFFHSDPQPVNILYDTDTGWLTPIDWGQIGELSADLRQDLVDLGGKLLIREAGLLKGTAIRLIVANFKNIAQGIRTGKETLDWFMDQWGSGRSPEPRKHGKQLDYARQVSYEHTPFDSELGGKYQMLTFLRPPFEQKLSGMALEKAREDRAGEIVEFLERHGRTTDGYDHKKMIRRVLDLAEKNVPGFGSQPYISEDRLIYAAEAEGLLVETPYTEIGKDIFDFVKKYEQEGQLTRPDPVAFKAEAASILRFKREGESPIRKMDRILMAAERFGYPVLGSVSMLIKALLLAEGTKKLLEEPAPSGDQSVSANTPRSEVRKSTAVELPQLDTTTPMIPDLRSAAPKSTVTTVNSWQILRLKQDVIAVVEQTRIDELSPEMFKELLEVAGLNNGKLHLVIPDALQGKYSERVAELRKVASVYFGFPKLATSDKVPVIGFSDMERDTLANFQKRLDPRLAGRVKDSAFGLNQAGSFGVGILYALGDVSRSELSRKNGYFYDAVGRWSTQVLEVLQAYTVISTSA